MPTTFPHQREVLEGLLAAREALAHSKPTHSHYAEPNQRHADAIARVDFAIAMLALLDE